MVCIVTGKDIHQRLGTLDTDVCRMYNDDVLEKYWSLTVLLDQIRLGMEIYQLKIDNKQEGNT
jgi:4-hydroxy-tetrahydrodipicolinate synthase